MGAQLVDQEFGTGEQRYLNFVPQNMYQPILDKCVEYFKDNQIDEMRHYLLDELYLTDELSEYFFQEARAIYLKANRLPRDYEDMLSELMDKGYGVVPLEAAQNFYGDLAAAFEGDNDGN